VSSKSNVKDNTGIVGGHAYAVLDVKVTSKGDKIIKIRNPWANKEGQGEWCDSSQKWTNKMLKEMNHEVKDDGVFWVTPQELIQNFDNIDVCKVMYNYKYSSIAFNQESNKNKVSTKLIKMKVNKKSHIFISINQKDKRHYQMTSNSKKYIYSRTRMLVVRIENGQI